MLNNITNTQLDTMTLHLEDGTETNLNGGQNVNIKSPLIKVDYHGLLNYERVGAWIYNDNVNLRLSFDSDVPQIRLTNEGVDVFTTLYTRR